MYYNKIPVYPVFYLLWGDYRVLGLHSTHLKAVKLSQAISLHVFRFKSTNVRGAEPAFVCQQPHIDPNPQMVPYTQQQDLSQNLFNIICDPYTVQRLAPRGALNTHLTTLRQDPKLLQALPPGHGWRPSTEAPWRPQVFYCISLGCSEFRRAPTTGKVSSEYAANFSKDLLCTCLLVRNLPCRRPCLPFPTALQMRR